MHTTKAPHRKNTAAPAPVKCPAEPSENETRKPDRRPWGPLVLLCVPQFMVILDATVVNVALPSIGRSLGFAVSDLQWVVTAYVLMTGGLMLLGGRGADLLGRRTVFLTGLVVFTAASLASVPVRRTIALMPELPEVEITARRLDAALRGAEIESTLAPGINALKTFDPPLHALDGRAIAGVRRIGKHLVVDVAGELHVLVHLMSAGRLQLYDKRASLRDRTSRLLIRTTDERELRRTAAPASIAKAQASVAEASASA